MLGRCIVQSRRSRTKAVPPAPSSAGYATRRPPPRHTKFDPNATAPRKNKSAAALPAWKARENDLRQELKELETQIDRLDKEEQARLATQHLPDLDEEALKEIYAGVQQADAIPPQELALLEHQNRKAQERSARALAKTGAMFPASTSTSSLEQQRQLDDRPRTFAERMQKRLEDLTTRLQQLQSTTEQSGVPSSSQMAQTIDEWKERKDLLQGALASVGREDVEQEEGIKGVEAEQGIKDAEQEEDTKDASQPQEEIEDHYREFQTVSLARQGPATQAEPPSLPEDDAGLATTTSGTSDDTLARPGDSDDVMARLGDLLSAVEIDAPSLPSAIADISAHEWSALGIASAQQGNIELLARACNLLDALFDRQQVAPETLTKFYDAVIDVFASRGDHELCQAFAARMVDRRLEPTSLTHHALIKSYLYSTDGNRTGQALSLLNHLEDTPMPASQATYSMVLTHLASQPDAAVQDQVWGVWYRMRLNAHPTPDAVAWGTMLRACAMGASPARETGFELDEGLRGTNQLANRQSQSKQNARGTSGQTEAALDLFKEMTIVEGIRPTPACYDYLILACCQGSRYLQGFRLFNDMIALAKETGINSYEPTSMTYNSLLAGCVAAKDLVRARWVLAEMIRTSASLWANPAEAAKLSWADRARLQSRMPDGKTLRTIFLTYATWQPPSLEIKPEAQRQDSTQQPTASSAAPETRATSAQEEETSLEDPLEAEEAASEFSSTPPATSAQVVREVQGLMARVISDRMPEEATLPLGPMSCVHLKTRLINFYLMALAAHLPSTKVIPALRQLVQPGDKSIFTRLGLEPDGHTYATVLRQCSRLAATAGMVEELADWTWTRWTQLEQKAGIHNLDAKRGVDVVNRQRCWSRRILYLRLRGDLDGAMTTLREFVRLYPPRPHESSLPAVDRKMPFFDFGEVERWYAQSTKRDLTLGLETSRQQQAALLPEGGSTDDQALSTTGPSSSAPWPLTSPIRPPSLSFVSLNHLHQRLVEAGPSRRSDVRFLTWCTSVWENRETRTGRKRREAATARAYRDGTEVGKFDAIEEEKMDDEIAEAFEHLTRISRAGRRVRADAKADQDAEEAGVEAKFGHMEQAEEGVPPEQRRAAD